MTRRRQLMEDRFDEVIGAIQMAFAAGRAPQISRTVDPLSGVRLTAPAPYVYRFSASRLVFIDPEIGSRESAEESKGSNSCPPDVTAFTGAEAATTS